MDCLVVMPLQQNRNIIIKYKTLKSPKFNENPFLRRFPQTMNMSDDIISLSTFGEQNKKKTFQNIEFLLLFDFYIHWLMKSHSSNPDDKRKNRTVSTFLKKTYELLNNSQNNASVRWAPSGIGFIIVNEDLFSKTVLPKYFKHSNYSSFVRQLNMYNFHKIRENSQESYFHHEYFNISNREDLGEIKRKPEKKKKKNNESDEQNSEPESSKTKKIQRVVKTYANYTKHSIGCSKQNTISDKKVESQKNTQNMFEEEGNCSIVRLPINQSSDQLSMQVQQEQRSVSERRLPGVPTRELISASKNNIFPLTISVQNVQTSIMSIFY